MGQYSALEQFSHCYKTAKTVGQAKKALIQMGLNFDNFEALCKSCLKFVETLGTHPSRCLVRKDLQQLVRDSFEIPDQRHFEAWGLRYFEEPIESE